MSEKDEYPEFKMPFGKFKGHDIEDIPSSYLRWLAENSTNDLVAIKADKEWKYRELFDKHFEDMED